MVRDRDMRLRVSSSVSGHERHFDSFGPSQCDYSSRGCFVCDNHGHLVKIVPSI